MRTALSADDVEELEWLARTPEQHRLAAETLVAWAEESHPDDEDVSPASLLVAAGTQMSYGGDGAAAVDLYRRAVLADGESPPDKRCYLHGELLRTGQEDAARRLADEIRRSAPDDPDVYMFMAEDYEVAGDLREAFRWVSRGQGYFDRLDPSGEIWVNSRMHLLLATRRRVRAASGYPPDDLDDLVRTPSTGR